ncbi:MAG: hypothetical protein SGJ27_26195 [Candidatus Melainabacteria bacterium]|nr:hypothetical protein [Candidatus Melainabacteria bacterium]
MRELNHSQDLSNPYDAAIPGLITNPDSDASTNSFEYTSTKTSVGLDAATSNSLQNLDSTSNTRLFDFSPRLQNISSFDLRAEVKVNAPASFDGTLPGLGISSGTDMYLPDVVFPQAPFEFDKNSKDQPPGSPEQAVKPASDLPANDRIVQAAEKNAGTKPWSDTKYSPQVQNGRLAGAAAVSVVLQDQGYKYADSANVGKLTDQLIKQGWSMVPADQAKAGDIIYGGRLGKDWKAGGGNAHVGIVGKDGKVWHNDSASGNWQQDSIASSFQEGKFGNQVWVLRPPQTNIPDKAPDRPVRPNSPDRPRPDRFRPEDYRPQPFDDTRVRPEDDLRPSDRSEASARILNVAKNSVNKRLWASSDFANQVKGGRLGCAASVSEVLRASGYDYANSAGVGNMVDILKDHGWTIVPLDQSRPGDVVYGGKPGTRWWEGGGNAHIGVVGERGQVFHNSSGRRHWVQDDLTKVFNTNRFGNQRYALRPPAKG